MRVLAVGLLVLRLRHLVRMAAHAVRAQRGRVREPLVAPLARQRLVSRVRVKVHLSTITVCIIICIKYNFILRKLSTNIMYNGNLFPTGITYSLLLLSLPAPLSPPRLTCMGAFKIQM